MTNKKSNFIASIAPNLFQVGVLIVAVAAAFYIGKLSTQVKYFEENAQMGAGANADRVAAPGEDLGPQPGDVSNLEFPTDGDHIRGDANAKIAIIEYSDFDCPFCGSFHETVIQLIEENPGEIMWVYRHFPLEQMHPEARGKAIASECAASLGGNDAFWAFSDELFENSTILGNVNSVAEKIGLDVDAFSSCLENEDTIAEIDYDLQKAFEVGVQGTPGGYVLNLETESVIPLRGAEPIENIRGIIGQSN